MTSASGETTFDESASDEGASNDLQNLFSSYAFLQHKLLFCRFHCSLFFLPKPMHDFKDTRILSMVMHAWTNINISNWHFLIPCYHQNSKVVLLNTFCSNTLRMLKTVFHERWIFREVKSGVRLSWMCFKPSYLKLWLLIFSQFQFSMILKICLTLFGGGGGGNNRGIKWMSRPHGRMWCDDGPYGSNPLSY